MSFMSLSPFDLLAEVLSSRAGKNYNYRQAQSDYQIATRKGSCFAAVTMSKLPQLHAGCDINISPVQSEAMGIDSLCKSSILDAKKNTPCKTSTKANQTGQTASQN